VSERRVWRILAVSRSGVRRRTPKPPRQAVINEADRIA